MSDGGDRVTSAMRVGDGRTGAVADIYFLDFFPAAALVFFFAGPNSSSNF
jgi:hypothetical protein